MINLGVSPEQLVLSAEQTLYMVFVALAIGTVLALLIAVTLVVSRQQGLIPNRRIYVSRLIVKRDYRRQGIGRALVAFVTEKAKELGITVKRVPGYSPESVAELAMALALAVNRRLYKAYNKVRENDYSLKGLRGVNFYKKTAGIVGTGKIGAAMCRICRGFGMRVIAYDVYENPSLKDFVEYVSLDELLAQSDLISLHCPLLDSTYHLINLENIKKMKDGVILVNTSRGALVDTNELIEGIRLKKFLGVGLDVYEEEAGNVYEDRSDDIMEHSVTARLLAFPNVMITSHQGFYTMEALAAIAETTLQNLVDAEKGIRTDNDVT